MPAMTKTALSDCSYPESTVYNIRDDIDTTITRLKVVIDEDASLRKALRVLFVKRRVDAIEQVRLANLHLDLINEEETAFCADLRKAAASANEGLEGSGSRDSIKHDETAIPILSLMTHETTGDHSFSKRLTGNGRDDDEPLENTPWTPRSTRALANEPTGTPGGTTYEEDICSIPSLSSSTIARYARSPARSTYALECLPKTPAYSTPRLANGPLPISPAHCNGVVYNRDTPHHSHIRLARGLEDDYLYPEAAPSQGTPGKTHISPPTIHLGEMYGFGIVEPKKSSLPVAALPTTFSFSGGFDATPAANTSFGFGVSPTANTNFGFGGRPMANTAFAFGVGSPPPSTSIDFGAASLGNNEAASNHYPREELDLVYEHADVVGASVEFGKPVNGQDCIQTPSARELSPVPELPEEPVVVVVMPNQKKKKSKKGSKINAVTPCEAGPNDQPFVEPLQDIQPEAGEVVDLDPPEDPPVVAVAPEKPKKGKKKKDFLKPEPSDAVMVPSPLEVYLREEEATLSRTQRRIDQYKENVKTLLQLIEKFERSGIVNTGALQKESGSQGDRTEADGVQPIENNGPTEEDIAILKKRLATEEGNVRTYLKCAQDEESRIVSYRRLIAASSS